MRYPVGQIGSKEEFEKFWYVAQGFGAKTDYGWHEGVDINLKTGGDTDLGSPLYAVANGRIKYYHLNSHPKTNFGRHMVLECPTPFGTRWYHYAHCEEITATTRDVTQGEIIGKIGKSGTAYAHLHFACFKVDPSTLRGGIDTIAKTQEELNKWWEDPFLTLASTALTSVPQLPVWLITLLQEFGLTIEQEAQVRQLFDKAKRYDQDILSLQEQLKSANEVLADKSVEISEAITKNQNLQGKIDALEEQLGKTQKERDELKYQLSLSELKLRQLESELAKKDKRIEDLLHEVEGLRADYNKLHEDFIKNTSFLGMLILAGMKLIRRR